jgi:hypothetical protein
VVARGGGWCATRHRMRTRLSIALALALVAGSAEARLRWQGTVRLRASTRPAVTVRARANRVAGGVIHGRWSCPRCPPPMRFATLKVWCNEYGTPRGFVGNRCTLTGFAADGATCFGRLAGLLRCGPPSDWSAEVALVLR